MITMLTSKCSLAGGAHAAASPRTWTIGPIATRLAERLSIWFERARQRRQLHALDDRMLKDIGLTRADIEFEARKHFWMR